MQVPNESDANDLDASNQRVLDRLVDGELTDAEERAVIAQLSQMPDGWRRCALALLEARCWQRVARHVQELMGPERQRDGGQEGDWGRHGVRRPLGQNIPLVQAGWPSRFALRRTGFPTDRRSMHWPTTLALCALLLLALGVGALLPRPWSHPAVPVPATAQHIDQRAAPVQLVDDGASQSRPSAGSVAQGSAIQNTVIQDAVIQDAVMQDRPATAEDLLLGNLTLVDNSGHQFDVPVYDWNQQVADQLMSRSQPLSSEFVRRLKRHRVRSHQSYVPLQLRDGRRVIVPVQELEIVPMGGTAY